MRVQFTATFDDLVDVHMRSMARTYGSKSRRWQRVGMYALGAGLVSAALTPGNRLEAGVFVGLLAGGVVGTDAPFEVIVELKPEGLALSQMRTHFTHEWSLVERIEDVPGAVIFWMEHSNLFAVRDRAFDSPETRPTVHPAGQAISGRGANHPIKRRPRP